MRAGAVCSHPHKRWVLHEAIEKKSVENAVILQHVILQHAILQQIRQNDPEGLARK